VLFDFRAGYRQRNPSDRNSGRRRHGLRPLGDNGGNRGRNGNRRHQWSFPRHGGGRFGGETLSFGRASGRFYKEFHWLRRFGSGRGGGVRDIEPKMTADHVGHVIVQRAGVCFLIVDSEFRKHLEDFARLHLEFPG